MTPIDIAWIGGEPMRITSSKRVDYSENILNAKGKVCGSKPWGFMAETCRPATDAEIAQWRAT